MNSLLERGIITELKCGTDFAYILADDDLFLQTEYKVLQNQWNSSFIKCMKMRFNGKMELLYLAGNLRPLSSMVKNLSADNFVSVVSKIFEQVVTVRENGFISCKNIDLSFDRIYVEPNTHKVSFIYLPIREHLFEEESLFESELRETIVKTIFSTPTLATPKTNQLMADLQNGSVSMHDLFVKYSDGSGLRAAAQSIARPTPSKTAGTPIGGNAMTGGLKVASPMPSGMKVASPMPGGPMMGSPMSEGPMAGKPMNGNPMMGSPMGGNASVGGLELQAINGEPGFVIRVNKKEFVIGKKENEVDCVIAFNNMISRKHCMIINRNNDYYAVDLQSSNGTFVNGMRLAPNQPQVLKNGDDLRLANTDFKVKL